MKMELKKNPRSGGIGVLHKSHVGKLTLQFL